MLSLTGVFSLLLLANYTRTTFLQRLRIRDFVFLIVFSMFEQEQSRAAEWSTAL